MTSLWRSMTSCHDVCPDFTENCYILLCYCNIMQNMVWITAYFGLDDCFTPDYSILSNETNHSTIILYIHSVSAQASMYMSVSSSATSIIAVLLEQSPRHSPHVLLHFSSCFLQLHLFVEQSPLHWHLISFRIQSGAGWQSIALRRSLPCRFCHPQSSTPVSYTHLTLPTNREV